MADTGNVLLVGPPDDAVAWASSRDAGSVLVVAAGGTAAGWLSRWGDAWDRLGARRFVSLGEASPGGSDADWSVESAASLPALGESLTDYLSAADRPFVYVDSVRGLADATSLERAFRFVHLATRLVEGRGGRAYVRAASDPDATVVRTADPLFEDVRTL